MTSPIHASVGPNGSGKSLFAVESFVRPALERGRPVVSTCWIDGGWALETPKQLPYIANCVLLLDEINSCFPSRESRTMPAEIGRLLNQLRKVGVIVVWTGPSWDRADKVLREVTQQVTLCRGLLGPPAKDEDGKRDPLGWRSHRLFSWKTYDVQELPEFSLGLVQMDRGKNRLRPKNTRMYWRKKDGSGAQSMYRTMDPVMLLDHLDETGNCFTCGGYKSRKRCSCKPGQAPRTVPPLRPWSQVRPEYETTRTAPPVMTPGEYHEHVLGVRFGEHADALIDEAEKGS